MREYLFVCSSIVCRAFWRDGVVNCGAQTPVLLAFVCDARSSSYVPTCMILLYDGPNPPQTIDIDNASANARACACKALLRVCASRSCVYGFLVDVRSGARICGRLSSIVKRALRPTFTVITGQSNGSVYDYMRYIG